MKEPFILIPGRTSRQGTSLNEGKFSAEYLQETATVFIDPGDLQRMAITPGQRVTLESAHGSVQVTCQAAKSGELQPGLLFIPYGDASSRLMGADTHGTGMPDSKGIDVELSIAPTPSSTVS